MAAFVRRRRLLLIAGAATIAAACGGARGRDAAVGASVGVAHDGGASSVDAGPRVVPPGLADFPAAFTAVSDAGLVSMGHAAGRWEAQIFADEKARPVYAATRGELPEGARLVEVHRERIARDAAAGPTMMMQKMPAGYDPEHGDVRYVVVDGAGRVVLDGRSESCSGCHDDAPDGRVFRVR